MPAKLTIESYGTPESTKVFFDDVEVKGIKNMVFSAHIDDPTINLQLSYALYKEKEDKFLGDIEEGMLLGLHKGASDEVQTINQTIKRSDQGSSDQGTEERR